MGINESDKNRRASSAYKLNFNSLWPMVYTFIFLFFLNATAKGSIAKANKRGDRGQPCLVPLLKGKNSELFPGLLILVFGEWKRALKPCRNLSEIPYLGGR